MNNLLIPFIFIVLMFSSCAPPEPDPVRPLPSGRQLRWHEMEFYAFTHFTLNTFTDKEWGFGDESPELFNPTELDTRQWARVCKEAGMKGIIVTAKHHDGFCLWPSEYTEHSVKNSPWRDGKGDLLRELSDACKEYGLKFGIYLSPWDRNHRDYGTPEYITYYRLQLKELLTNYGDIFEVWFDGANGGTGYYGGANENRHVDRKTYYDWPTTRRIVRELQPWAMMFSDAGPDVRWVGNEQGWAGETNWCALRREEFYPGSPNYKELTNGHEDGTHWVPAEVDVSIRPGWFYHASEDHKVKTVKQLVDIYYHSVGRNTSLLLNLPPDRRGLIPEIDVERLKKFTEVIRNDFKTNLAVDVDAEASNVRGNAGKYNAEKAIDGDKDTYWATDDGVTTASLTIDFGKPTTFNRFLVQEYIPLGQRVKKFSVEAFVNGEWKPIDTQTTIGYKRILRFDNVTADKLRFNVLDSKACPLISNIGVYHAPKLLEPPAISRDKNGLVSIEAFDSQLEIFYTLHGSKPDASSEKYSGPFELKGKGSVMAVVHDPETGKNSEISMKNFDICKEKWTVVSPSPGKDPRGKFLIDAKERSVWKSDPDKQLPQSVVIDLGESLMLKGFTYLPTQARYIDGTVAEYAFYVSNDGRNWTKVAEGEFSNIKNNPVEQTVTFKPVKARYIEFRGIREIDDRPFITIAEIGVVTE